MEPSLKKFSIILEAYGIEKISSKIVIWAGKANNDNLKEWFSIEDTMESSNSKLGFVTNFFWNWKYKKIYVL